MQPVKRLAIVLATLAIAGLGWSAVDAAAAHHSSRTAGAASATRVAQAGDGEIDWP